MMSCIGPGGFDQRLDAGQTIKFPHDGFGIAEIRDGLEQRRHDQFGRRPGLTEIAVQQPEFLLQQKDFEKIAHGFSVWLMM